MEEYEEGGSTVVDHKDFGSGNGSDSGGGDDYDYDYDCGEGGSCLVQHKSDFIS